MKSTKIGFVGVGRMGANMARRLKEVGYPVAAVFDSNRESRLNLARSLDAIHPASCLQLASYLTPSLP